MEKALLKFTLIDQERKASILFVILFYCTYVIYDFFYYFAMPLIVADKPVGYPNSYLGYGMYGVLLLLLPIALLCIKMNHPRVVKYLYFFSFMILISMNEVIVYRGTDGVYTSSNFVELLFIIFSPIFINKRFFWLVSIGTSIKYIVIGFVIQAPEVIMPIVLVLGISLIVFIILIRFKGYVRAVETSFNTQFESIVRGVIATIELKDVYTRGHSERVASYSMIMAQKLNMFSKEVLQNFYYSCLLHDLGKVHTPDRILTKPDSLTSEEYEIIKQHPVVGAETVRGIEGLESTVDVVRHHHERWDGKGYPDNLKELSIPLLARIAAISDAFDAMTTIRSYRPAMLPEEAYKRIVEGSGTQFDPRLVNVFKEVYAEWLKIVETYKP